MCNLPYCGHYLSQVDTKTRDDQQKQLDGQALSVTFVRVWSVV